MKKKLLFIALLVVCLGLLTGGTLAYFTATEIATNVITAGTIEVDLLETDAEGSPFRDVTGVMPGAEIEKIVTVKNISEKSSCWVRISVEKKIQLAEGKSGETDLGLLGLDINDKNWTEKDGYFYYNEELKPGAATEPLFTTVTFAASMDNTYQGSTAEIIVQVQTVQTANNGSTVLEAAGWPAE